MQCELGGREAALVATRVAGTVLHACSACTGSGRKATAREAMGQEAWVTQSLAKRAHRQQVNDEAPGDMLRQPAIDSDRRSPRTSAVVEVVVEAAVAVEHAA